MGKFPGPERIRKREKNKRFLNLLFSCVFCALPLSFVTWAVVDYRRGVTIEKSGSPLLWETLSEAVILKKTHSPQIETILRHPVQLAGYMIGRESDSETVEEFLLTPIEREDSHDATPAPNWIVHVTLPSGKKMNTTFELILVTGKLKLIESRGDKFQYPFELLAESVDRI